MRIRIWATATAIALLMLAAACGSSDDGGSDDSAADDQSSAEVESPDDNGGSDDDESSGDNGGGSGGASVIACDVLTLDDLTSRGIEATTGPIPTDSPVEGFDVCSFTDSSGAQVVAISVQPPSDGQGAIGDAEPIPGIGAEANYSPAARAINVELDDGTTVSIGIPFSAPPDDPRDVLIELAQVAVG